MDYQSRIFLEFCTGFESTLTCNGLNIVPFLYPDQTLNNTQKFFYTALKQKSSEIRCPSKNGIPDSSSKNELLPNQLYITCDMHIVCLKPISILKTAMKYSHIPFYFSARLSSDPKSFNLSVQLGLANI